MIERRIEPTEKAESESSPVPGSRHFSRGRRPLAVIQEQQLRIRELERERAQQAMVLRLNNLLVSQLEPESLFRAISSALWQELRHDFMGLSLIESGGTFERVLFMHLPKGGDLPQEPIQGRVEDMLSAGAFKKGRVDILGPSRFQALDVRVRHIVEGAGVRSICCLPLIARGQPLGCLCLGSLEDGHFSDGEANLLGQIGVQLALALDNSLAYRDIQVLKDKLAEEKLFLEEEVGRDFATREIVGKSQALSRVMNQIATVAPSDATVLILGETGTGKELLARAIHERSRRVGRTFVKVNCSAIPLGLLESELFGHERGAFTGAIQRKIGRFELANLGTLFLDEVGDLPLDLQPKLLRAIQEREFERLGNTVTQHVDVRIIAATHRSLSSLVEKGQFRQDLFYRLNVFPIHVPPLRERKEDIPDLVRNFTQKFALQLDRKIERIPASTMDRLQAWHWPGNIRELQNIVERSVILCKGGDLRVPAGDLEPPDDEPTPEAAGTLEELERREILKVMKECRGVIGGPGGAAARLGLKRTTLNSRMKKLGITREDLP